MTKENKMTDCGSDILETSELVAVKARLAEVMKERDELLVQVDKLRKSRKKLVKERDKLAKSKLGRFMLLYWRVKGNVISRLKQLRHPYCNVAKGIVPKGDEKFYERISAKIVGMPESNGCRYYEKSTARIGLICDPIFYDSISCAADFVYITPNVTEDQLAALDCLLLVSTWFGLDDVWRGIAKEGSEQRQRSEAIVDFCRKHGIPTVFYSKEDPPNYDVFVGQARLCDFVFTSAEECIDRYRLDCGHNRIYTLSFCINPRLHNPVGMRYAKTKERGVIFSGAWRPKYPQRCVDHEMILDAVLACGHKIRIIDRDYHRRHAEKFRFPEKYLKYQSPSIDHDELSKVHKMFNWAININSVKDSATMFAARVYELQALGNKLISNGSIGMSRRFPDVIVAENAEDVKRALCGVKGEALYASQISGIRQVMSGETCFDRVWQILSAIGFVKASKISRRITVVADELNDRIKDMFGRQSVEEKRLVSMADFTEAEYCDCDIVAFFNDGAEYGEYYLEDMANAFKYTDCDYITKDAYLHGGKLVKGVEHGYVSRMGGKGRSVFWRRAFTRDFLLGLVGGIDLPNGYSIDHFNFNSYVEDKRRLPWMVS